MPDFLLEIGCEEIPARMIDAAQADLRDACRRTAGRARSLGSTDSLCLDYASPACGDARRMSAITTGCDRAGHRSVGERRLSKMDNRLRQRTPSPRRRASMYRNCARHHPEGRIPVRPSHEKWTDGAAEILPKLCPRKSRRFTGPRTCIGASRVKNSCVRCAGWWRCSTGR